MEAAARTTVPSFPPPRRVAVIDRAGSTLRWLGSERENGPDLSASAPKRAIEGIVDHQENSGGMSTERRLNSAGIPQLDRMSA